MNGLVVIPLVLTIAGLLVAASQIAGTMRRDEWQRSIEQEERRREALR